jgi:hypothetical protein
MGYFSTVRWVSQGKRIGVWGTGEGERVGVLAYRRVGVGKGNVSARGRVGLPALGRRGNVSEYAVG